MSSVYQNRRAFLLKLIEQHGSQSKLAEKVGISPQQMGHIGGKNPVRNIGEDLARRIESRCGLPLGIMDQGPGVDVSKVQEESIEVPLLNITVSAGAGVPIPWSEEVVHKILLSKQWVRQHTTASSFNTLAVVTAHGDSMAPTFSDGDVLLVDASVSSIRLDAVYVLSRDGELFIKRIQRNVDGSLMIISDNPAYQPQQIDDPAKAGLLVLGRVLVAWSPKKL
jgi:SOS-response transcriptional repressor LexA